MQKIFIRWAGVLVLLLLALGQVAEARVADDGSMFSASTVAQLNQRIASINSTYGKDVWIITVPELGGQSWQTILDRATAGNQINGLAILLAKNDHKINVWVGNQTRAIFPDSRVSIIKQTITSNFKQGRFDDGIVAGLAQIEDTFRMNLARNRTGVIPTSSGPVTRRSSTGHTSSGSGWGFGLFGLIFFLIIMAIGAFFLFSLIRAIGRAATGGGGGYSGPGYGGGGNGPGYGGGGYGGGGGFGGGGGGGFWQGMLGGLGGAVAGNWLYDKFSGRSSGYGGSEGGGYTGGTSSDFGGSAPSDPSWTQQDTGGGFTGESSWSDSSSDSGSSWGSSSGDVGGGMDWGGGGDSGGGGGDW